MLFHLAQIEPPAGFVAFASSFMYVIVSLAAIVGLWQMLRPKSADKTEISGQPIEVREHEAFATRVEHRELAARVDQELGRERGARKLIHEQISRLQANIAKIEADNAAQTRAVNELKAGFGEMNGRVDAIPHRTIDLFAKTKQLHQ
jgi:hypothetical protein